MVSADDERAPGCGYLHRMASLRARYLALDPLRADLALAGLFALESVIEIAAMWGTRNASAAALCLVGVVAALAIRRYAPLPAVLVVLVSYVALETLGRGVDDHLYAVLFAILFVLFSFGMHAGDDRPRVVAAMLLAAAGATLSNLVDTYPNTALDYVFSAVILGLGPILLGRLISSRTRLNHTLREKAEQLRRERAAEGERAAEAERTRIAGELHDVVAHAMSAMVVQASAARRLVERDPARAGEAFGAVETTGREALTEIRRLLGVLRREDEQIALAPQPSLRHLAALVRRSGAAGLPVALSVEGEERDLPPGVDLTAYRLVQEALGGAREQGAAGRAEVRVRYRHDALELEVLDDGEGGGAEPRPLAGVRERVGLYGGRVTAGRRRAGGHAVRAELPTGGGA
jgi:signal transduction histidine kinase